MVDFFSSGSSSWFSILLNKGVLRKIASNGGCLCTSGKGRSEVLKSAGSEIEKPSTCRSIKTVRMKELRQ